MIKFESIKMWILDCKNKSWLVSIRNACDSRLKELEEQTNGKDN